MTDKLDCALDLMRRLPPAQIEDNLAGLIDLVPDLTEELLSAVDQPLKIAYDSHSKRDYLLCDYNRDGDSYRYVSLASEKVLFLCISKIIQHLANAPMLTCELDHHGPTNTTLLLRMVLCHPHS
jgi:hypothetical protein